MPIMLKIMPPLSPNWPEPSPRTKSDEQNFDKIFIAVFKEKYYKESSRSIIMPDCRPFVKFISFIGDEWPVIRQH